jgi:hypothetical protein
MPFRSCDVDAEQPLLDADVIDVGGTGTPPRPSSTW